MALRTPPSWLQNGSHPAENDRLATQGLFRTSGILSAADLAVTQSTVPAMSVQIAAGWGNIIGTTQANMGAYQYYNDAAATATITTADVTNPRIDLICITINDAYYTGVTNNVAINVVAGTPAASPAVPTLPANSYALAQVAVAANATTIVNANITDLRQVVTLVNVAQSVAGKNALINGGMDIWQRGTSFTDTITSISANCADRWSAYTGTTGRTITQVASDLTNFQYFLRYQRNAAIANLNTHYFLQNIETKNSLLFAGKQVTLSFRARAGANYSSVGNALTAQVRSSTTVDGNVLGNFLGSLNAISQSIVLTTSWQTFTLTGTVDVGAQTLAVVFFNTPVGTAGANDYFDITGVQLELGSTATTFSRAGGSIGGEDTLCQRYLPRLMVTNDAELGYAFSATQTQVNLKTKVTTRKAMTSIVVSSPGHFNIVSQGFGSGAATAIAFNSGGQNSCQINVTTIAATPTLAANQFATLQGINASAQILGDGCEL